MSVKLDGKKRSVISYLGLLMVAMIWGFAFVVVKSSLDVVPPVYMIAFRFSIAAVGMIVIFFKRLLKMTKKTLIHGIIPGLFLFSAYVIQTIGCKYTTAGNNAFLTAIYIIIVPFLHWIMKKKRPKIRLFAAAVIAFVGIGFISLQGDFTMGLGDGLTVICGILFALQIVFLDHYLDDEDPMVITTIELVVSAVLGWIVAPLIDGGFPMEAMKLETLWSMLFLGLISTLVCQLLQCVCQKYTRPENASLIMSLESLFGALGGFLFLHETMSVKTLIGCVLMMGAILLAQIKIGQK